MNGFAINGAAINAEVLFILDLSAGSYVETGEDAILARGYIAPMAAGAALLDGQAATFLRGYVVASVDGAVVLSGSDIGAVRGYQLPAVPAEVTVHGDSAELLKGIFQRARQGLQLQLDQRLFIVQPEAAYEALPGARRYTVPEEQRRFVV